MEKLNELHSEPDFGDHPCETVDEQEESISHEVHDAT